MRALASQGLDPGISSPLDLGRRRPWCDPGSDDIGNTEYLLPRNGVAVVRYDPLTERLALGRPARFRKPTRLLMAARGLFRFVPASAGAMMETERSYERYRELQSYVGWSDDDVGRIVAAGPILEPHLPVLIDDFYDEIERHPGARKVITGGAPQIE